MPSDTIAQLLPNAMPKPRLHPVAFLLQEVADLKAATASQPHPPETAATSTALTRQASHVVGEAERQRLELEQRVRALEMRLRLNQQQLAETERARQHAEERVESLTRAHDDVREQWRGVCVGVASQQSGLAAAVTELESKLTACSSETERARQLAEERAESLTRAHDGVCERWRGVCAEDASKQLGLAAAVTELETKLAACHAREGQLEQQAHDLIAREQLLRDQLVKLEANAASAEQQLMAKVKLLEASDRARQQAEELAQALTRAHSPADLGLGAAQPAQVAASDAAARHPQPAHDELSTLRAQAQQLVARAAAADADAHAAHATADLERRTLLGCIDALQRQAADASATADGARRSEAELRAALHTAERERAALSAQLDAARAECAAMERRCAEAERKVPHCIVACACACVRLCG